MAHLQGLEKAVMGDKIVKIVKNFTLFHQCHHVNQPLFPNTMVLKTKFFYLSKANNTVSKPHLVQILW